MERQPRHSRVSHFPGAPSGSAGLRLLLGNCSPGVDLDTHVVATQLRAHTDREVKVQEGAVNEEPHTRAPSPLHYLQLLQGTSEQGPASRGILPNTPPPPPLPLTPRPLPARLIDTAPGIFRISWWAGLGCDFVPSHTRGSAPSGQRWRCHFVSAPFLHIRHTLFPHKDLILGKPFACQTAYIKNGECVSCLWALWGTACSGGPSYASVACCRVFLCTALPHLHSNPLRQLEPLIPVSLGTVDTPIVTAL